MQIGLLGKANVGKSTFFSAATETPAQAGNFPFTTIEPNVGVAHVRAPCPCAELGVSHDTPSCDGGTRLIPVRLVDVAGLVPGAHEGRGLGNRFLDDARQSDALIHVVDAAGATDEQGQPVPPGTRDPLEDVRFVTEEFDRWFSQILEREWQKVAREAGRAAGGLAGGIARRFSGLGVGEGQVRGALQAAGLDAGAAAGWGPDDLLSLATEIRRRAKPMLVAANKADLCAEAPAGSMGGFDAVPCSAEAELLLRRAARSGLVSYSPGAGSFEVAPGAAVSPQQGAALEQVRSVFSRIGGTGVQAALEAAVFGALGMVAAYPVEDESRLSNRDGEVLPDARLLPLGSTARDLAASVHEDIARGFLHAVDCRTGQRVGADHELRGGDVVRIVSTLSRG